MGEDRLMPQVQLPLFPEGTTLITPELAFQRRDQQVIYLNGHLPVFTHTTDDLASFRFFTTQLIVNGTATQGQIVKAFGGPLTTVKRYMRHYRERGAAAFFKPAAKRQGHRLTPERLLQAQQGLDEGRSVPEVSAQLGVLAGTVHFANIAGTDTADDIARSFADRLRRKYGLSAADGNRADKPQTDLDLLLKGISRRLQAQPGARETLYVDAADQVAAGLVLPGVFHEQLEERIRVVITTRPLLSTPQRSNRLRT